MRCLNINGLNCLLKLFYPTGIDGCYQRRPIVRNLGSPVPSNLEELEVEYCGFCWPGRVEVPHMNRFTMVMIAPCSRDL